ncbi:MAG: MarR family winged helix-turn-helix transcriptional regulator [Dehalococcoidia bacterium]|nr:MarR family winged helix-turn-helix transcriptional regulator [Dehalococcoidia bacterium]
MVNLLGNTKSPKTKSSLLPEEDIDRELWSILRNVGHVMKRVRDRELSRYGVTTRQAGILHHVHALGEKATPTAIARATYREPTTVSAILSRMEKQGLIKKVKSGHRKNRVRIVLTDKGERIRVDAAGRESVKRIMSRLPVETRYQLLLGLREFRRSLVEELAESYRNSFLEKVLGKSELSAAESEE